MLVTVTFNNEFINSTRILKYFICICIKYTRFFKNNKKEAWKINLSHYLKCIKTEMNIYIAKYVTFSFFFFR